MIILVKLIALLILVMGGLYLVNPSIMKKYVSFWAKGSRIRLGAILSFIIGIIFLMAAPRCRVSMVVTIMGIISVLKGVVLSASGVERAKAMLNKWQNKSQGTVRFFGLLAIAIGVLLLRSV